MLTGLELIKSKYYKNTNICANLRSIYIKRWMTEPLVKELSASTYVVTYWFS